MSNPEITEVTNTEINNAKNNKFAQMNGVVVEEESPQFTQEQLPSPEEIVTERQAWQKPLPKAVLISGGVFVVVGFFASMIGSTINAINSSTAQKQQRQASENLQELSSSSEEENQGRMKTEIALGSQNRELESLNKLRSRHQPISKETITNKTTKPLSVPVHKPIEPQRREIYVAKPREIYVTRSREIHAPQISYPKSKYVVPSRVPGPSRPTPQPVSTPSESLDPAQQWLAVANIGSLSLEDNDSDTATSVASEELPSGGTGVQAVSKNPNETNSLTQNPQSTNYSGKQVLVGSRATGVLETPLAWTSNDNGQQQQKYLIRLTEPIKANDGSVVVRANSYIVVQITNTNLSEFVQLSATSAVVNENGRAREKPIPENTILVLGKEGKALRGKAKKGSTLVGDLTASVLSGVSKAAEVYNRSDSETTISSGVATTVTSSNKRNLAAGFTEGSMEEIVRRMQASNQQRLQEIQSEPKVYLIEQGTPVEIFVNQSVSL